MVKGYRGKVGGKVVTERENRSIEEENGVKIYVEMKRWDDAEWIGRRGASQTYFLMLFRSAFLDLIIILAILRYPWDM